MAERRVVVTGAGAVSPLGIGFNAFAEGLLGGRCGIGPVTQFDASRTKIRGAAECTEYADELLPSDPRHHVVLSRPMQLGLVAAAEAVASAGLADDADVRANTACLMALNRWDICLPDFGESFSRSMEPDPEAESGYRFNRKHYLSRGARAAHPLWLLKFIPNLAVAHIVRTFGMQGEANTYISGASASTQLVGDAVESIRAGHYDVALCGGSDSRMTPLGFVRYMPLGLLAESETDELPVSMPFDRDRRGYVMGEGSAFFVVEALEHAERRGAVPIAELVGWGDGADAHHPCLAHPEGRGLRTSMRGALQRADLAPSDVDCLIATATSQVDLDSAEAAAVRAVFGHDAPAVTAPAGAIGGTHIATGALNLAAALAAIKAQAVPPTLGTQAPDEDAPANLVTGAVARPMPVRTVMANAYSIGGQCGSLLVREFVV